MYNRGPGGVSVGGGGTATSVTVAAVLILFVAASYYMFQPPAPLSPNAPLTEFSAVRAMVHDKAIAGGPHPAWSPAADQVRNYIVAHLQSLGLDPQIQSTTALRIERGNIGGASVKNIVARIPGTANTRAVLIAAHYDSVPTGPGASDDGSGVSTILETVRALKAGQPLKNDLIVLITDAEEEGLLGAAAFVAENPLVKDVGVTLNFEARGAGGPSFMFETSKENGWLIDQFSKAAPHPAANSLTYALYEMLPNDTDMTEFKRAGLSGLNFAYAGDWFRYHTALDTPENLDQRSLQQDGSYALSLVKELGNIDLRQTKKPDDIYFTLIGPIFIHYPESLSLTIAVIGAAAFIAMFIMGRRRQVIKLGGAGLGFIAVPLTLIVAFGGAWAVWWAVKKLRPDYSKAPWGDPYNGLIYFLALILLTIALSSLIYVWVARRTNIQSISAGALVWGVVAAIASALLLPGGSFVFAWPLLFSVIGLIYLITQEEHESSLSSSVVLCLTALPLFLLGTPIIYGLYLLVSMNAAAALMVIAAAFLVPLVPHLLIIMKAPRVGVLILAALIVILVGAGLFTGKPGPNRRSIDDVFYALNADTGQAHWVSVDAKPDEWTSQFLGSSPERQPLREYLPLNDIKALSSSAPAAPLASPQLQTVSDESINAVRTLELRAASSRGAPAMLITFPNGIAQSDVLVNGKPIPPAFEKGGSKSDRSREGWYLFYTSLPKEGISLRLKLNASDTSKLKLGLYDITFSLPQVPDMQIGARPDYLMPAPYFVFSDTTIVSKSFEIPIAAAAVASPANH